ncbi:hypothetical protein Nepgr_006486 [Nepenthes gracilis]|uniref:Mechanosensitive ion channel protein n=1 Tax=Nepenthes gracilis TaxID=150966 RepID=A0AAD3S5B5_NEPGR|nr:hypothetical protein Nepgr_006486 [Nepenthes gracilis]
MAQSFSNKDPKPQLAAVKIEGGVSLKNAAATDGNPIWRDSSYDFRNDVVKGCPKDADDDSSEFDFGKHQENTREVDLESQSCLSPVSESPNEYGKITPRGAAKVSFKESELTQRRPSHGGGANLSCREEEVVRCSGNASLQRKSTLLEIKAKSRLLDPPDGAERRSGKVMKSGLVAKNDDYEDDDPFLDEDIPEEYRKMKFSVFSIIQWLSLISIIAALVCSIGIPVLRRITIWDMQLWKWEVMGLVLICGGLVSGWLIRLVVFLIERNFLLRKRVLYFVYGLRNAVQNCLWLGWVLVAWNLILDKKVEKETNSNYLPYVTKIFVCLLVGTLIWLLKTLLVKVLAMSFHVSTFFDRIQEALFNQHVIETLSGPPLIEIQRIHEDEERIMSEVQNLQNAGASIPADLRATCLPNPNGKVTGSGQSMASGLQKSPVIGKSPRTTVIGKSPRFSGTTSRKEEEEGGISIDHLHRWNQKNISAWNMKRLMNIVRKGFISTLDERILDSGMEDESSLYIRSEKQAKAAARRIFNDVARPGSKYIYLEDLMRFMREDEATRAMCLFEGSVESKGITKRALKNWVVNVFRERRALALSLNDTKTAVNKLHHLLNVVVGFIIVIIWLLILGVPITHFLVFLTSQLLLLTFVFGNTFKTTFEAIIFLFVMHPFDVGDRCEVEEVQMVVEEMNILTTVFLRYDNQKIIYPNSVLATKPISNYYRSPDMGDGVDFCVHISTPVEKIAIMKERITRYIENKKEHWYPAPMIVMRDVEDMNRLKFSVWLSHTMNHQDMGERWARRALLVEEMVKIFRELDIEYRMLPYDVNVKTMPAIVSDRFPSNWMTTAGK